MPTLDSATTQNETCAINEGKISKEINFEPIALNSIKSTRPTLLQLQRN
jgi:hypothetical protein